MPLDSYVQQDVPTPGGVVRVWTTPQPPGTLRPMVFAIPGMLSTTDNFIALGDSFGLLADLCLMRLPIAMATRLADGSLGALSQMVGGLIEELFPGRPVLLLGMSSGALIALGVRAANLARIIAIEPPLVTGELWPITTQLDDYLRGTKDPATTAFALETLGVGEDRIARHDHLGLLNGLNVPVDVLLGEEPLRPERKVARFPSLVGEPERRALAAQPGVRLHIVPGTGHNVLGQALHACREIVLEGCRRSAAPASARQRTVDEPLLEAIPLATRRALHWGPNGEALAAAFARINPGCELVLAGDALPQDGAPFDVIVASQAPSASLLPSVAAHLRDEGHLIARWGAPREDVRAALAAQGLALREPVDAGGTGVIRAQKLAAGAAPRPALAVCVVAFSPLLMDIRTRLPARAMGSDPDLQVGYHVPPFELPDLPMDHPKILLMQRPAEERLDSWRMLLAKAIRKGWLVVMEFDDYPKLIAEVTGRAFSEASMPRFGYVHALQTATPPLVELFGQFNPETVMFPNAVFDLPPFPDGPRPPRVFYGGVLRGRYPVTVAGTLGPAIARHPEVEFVVVGDRAVFDALPTERKTYYEYMPFESYLDLMGRCAISLSPIEALPMRDSKSDAKFLDAARAGVLTIASPTIYDRVITHGVNGLLAPEVADWADLLSRALSEPQWRQGMARRAWKEVRDRRMFADQVAQRRDWYWALWARRAELNEAIMGRIAGLREEVYAGAVGVGVLAGSVGSLDSAHRPVL